MCHAATARQPGATILRQPGTIPRPHQAGVSQRSHPLATKRGTLFDAFNSSLRGTTSNCPQATRNVVYSDFPRRLSASCTTVRRAVNDVSTFRSRSAICCFWVGGSSDSNRDPQEESLPCPNARSPKQVPQGRRVTLRGAAKTSCCSSRQLQLADREKGRPRARLENCSDGSRLALFTTIAESIGARPSSLP